MSLLLQSGVAWLLVVGVCVLGIELGFSRIAPALRRAALKGRVLLVVGLAWLPVLLATLIVVGCYLPWVLASLGWSHDHCVDHGGHIHLCVQHVHMSELAFASWFLFFATALWLGRGAVELWSGVARGIAFERSLSVVAYKRDDWSVLDARFPFSVTSGVVSPEIYITSGLLDVLSNEQARAVLAHERCHAHERHALYKLVAAVGAMWLRAPTRQTLLDELALACERRSDEAAAASVGDRLAVASALLACRRALPPAPEAHGVLALDGSEFEVRIRMLADVDTVSTVASNAVAATVGGTLLSLAAGHFLHHEIETALSYFLS